MGHPGKNDQTAITAKLKKKKNHTQVGFRLTYIQHYMTVEKCLKNYQKR